MERAGIKVDVRNARASIWDIGNVQFHSYIHIVIEVCSVMPTIDIVVARMQFNFVRSSSMHRTVVPT